MPRTSKPAQEIQNVIDKHDWASEESHAPQVEEMGVQGWMCLPKEETMRQREKFFKGIAFRGLEAMLKEAEKGFV